MPPIQDHPLNQDLDPEYELLDLALFMRDRWPLICAAIVIAFFLLEAAKL